MPGGTYQYRCDRCPLIIELGGGSAWGDDGRVYQTEARVACGACGTMHRLTEENGTSRVTAFPGPVRGMRAVTVRDVGGDEVQTEEFGVEGEVREVGDHPGGIAALGGLACGHCGQVGRMVTPAAMREPDGRYRQPYCPVCGDPMDAFGVTDWI